MTPFDWINIIGAACGAVMVLGGIYCLVKGIIKLTDATPNEAISVEFRRMLTIRSSVPSISLFIVGLIFIICAAVFARPGQVVPITLQGDIAINRADGDATDDDPANNTVTLSISSDTWATIIADSNGHLNNIAYPDTQRIKVQINAAGCQPESAKFTLPVPSNHVITLPKVTFTRKVSKPGKGEIVSAPKLPPVDTKN